MRKALLVLVFGLLLSACNVFTAKPINQKANADPYEATSAQARPDVESHIELSDGAGISIPAGALSAEITVKVERNPEKAQKLPPLDEGLLPVSNFYNFEIAGGELNDRVDLILPFDKSLIPQDQKNGFLVAAVPNETGWSYVPVEPTGDKVILWTDQIGDPIIAWHFVDEENYPLLCSPYMDIQIDPQAGTSGTEFTVVGRVKTIKPTFLEEILGRNTKKEAANIPVSIYLSPVNYIEEHNAALTVTTDDSGYFSAKLPGEITPGWWYLRAEAKCVLPEGTLFKKISGSEGRVTFRVMPEDVQAVDSPTQEADVVPTVKVNPQATVSPIPSGAIQIPDVVGLSLDDAVKKLENLGFGVTWVDGKSSLELGQIYQQKPAAGEYFVPHRTTVVVYRTQEKMTLTPDPYGCDNTELTPEEKANCGQHEYISSGTYDQGGCYFAGPYDENRSKYYFQNKKNKLSVSITQTGLEFLPHDSYSEYKRTSENTFVLEYEESGYQPYHWIITLILNDSGFTTDSFGKSSIYTCNGHYEYELIKQ